MLSRSLLRFVIVLAAVALMAVSCARKPESPPADAPSEGAAAVAPASPVPEPSAAREALFAFTDADLEAFERGLAKEIQLVRSAKARADAATTPEERGLAAQAQFEHQTAPEAARSIGVDPVRYEATRETVVRVLTTLDFQGKIDGPMELDKSRASPDMVARVEGDAYAGLPPASAAALQARLPRLVPLWKEYLSLTIVSDG